ncbi:MAG: hypothetical protein KME22_13375 [Hassallia sp. WJT32-NPBG1]|jgi:hypothetical protein|nr:hypothetical protein [Hassallia sp. WJT32-NPBG1]
MNNLTIPFDIEANDMTAIHKNMSILKLQDFSSDYFTDMIAESLNADFPAIQRLAARASDQPIAGFHEGCFEFNLIQNSCSCGQKADFILF